MVSGIFFGYGGWMTPVATGFAVVGDKLNTLGVQNAPPVAVHPDGLRPGRFCSASSWEHCFHDLGTGEEYSCFHRDYDGRPDWGQLSQLLYGWLASRLLFMVNLRLPSYLSGSFQPIAGIDMNFSVVVLLAWAIGAVLVSFAYFC